MDAATTIGSLIIIVGAPLLPSFGFVENNLVRMILVAVMAYAAYKSPVLGILAFLAAFTLLVERNHELITKLPNQKPKFPTGDYGYPIQAEKHMPVTSTSSYIPESVNDLEKEKPFEESDSALGLRDSIPRLSAAPLTDDAPNFYKTKNLL